MPSAKRIPKELQVAEVLQLHHAPSASHRYRYRHQRQVEERSDSQLLEVLGMANAEDIDPSSLTVGERC